MTDQDWIALTLYGESRGESTAGRLAVASVLKNRLRLGRWGHTYEAVCVAPKQFSCWNATDPNLPLLKEKIGQIQTQGGPELDPVLRECYWIAEGLLSDALLPQVGAATHYYANSLKIAPKWAQPPAELVRAVGHHLFFDKVA